MSCRGGSSVDGIYVQREGNVSKKRKEVVTSITDAASKIKDEMTIAVGGFGADNHPETA